MNRSPVVQVMSSRIFIPCGFLVVHRTARCLSRWHLFTSARPWLCVRIIIPFVLCLFSLRVFGLDRL